MMFWKIIIISLLVSSFITIINIGGRNLIVFLLAIELVFFTGSISCIVYYFNNINNHWNYDILFAALAITVLAAAESTVGLALVARLHKQTKSIKIDKIF
jgi:NADH:ubiquinone oxidoreductase subunit K